MLSRWNGIIDLSVAKLPAIIKVVEGLETDSAFAFNIRRAVAAGVLWMPSGKPVPETGDPERQADVLWWHSNSVAGRPPMVPSLDCDGMDWDHSMPSPVRARFLRRHIDRVIHHAGKEPSIYLLDNTWNELVMPGARELGISFDDCVMRQADYRRQPGLTADSATWWDWLQSLPESERQPDHVEGFTEWGGWQFSADGNGLAEELLGPDVADPDVSINMFKRWAWPRLLLEAE